ncbi:hypothetical protein [Actinoplanes sp. HUAS TT8]|uniref:hypothetical protein n=1 Tax=Actinoplanes sp. HUAS TT8 TaxID=3447453 RepID=UPI003F527337
MPAFAATVVTLVLGAGLGFLPTFLMERAKQRTQIDTRWDAELYRVCADFTATARQLMHATGRPPEERELVDDLHARLRALREQIRILGSLDVQESARRIQSHSFWLRALREGRADEGEGNDLPPDQRVMAELPRFYAAVRRQLRVPAADQVDLVPFGPADARIS